MPMTPMEDYAKDGGEEFFTKVHCVRSRKLERIFWDSIIEGNGSW